MKTKMDSRRIEESYNKGNILKYLRFHVVLQIPGPYYNSKTEKISAQTSSIRPLMRHIDNTIDNIITVLPRAR